MSRILSLEYNLQSWQLCIYVFIVGVLFLSVWNVIVFLALGSKDGSIIWHIKTKVVNYCSSNLTK